MLLIERADISLIEHEIITENEIENYFVYGKFLQSEVKNKNKRVYPKHVLEGQVTKYIQESIKAGSSYGELDHPEDRLELASREISHLITTLEWQNNSVFGKAQLLDTPAGNIAKALLKGGGKLGMSSRGSGTVKEGYVQNDYRLITVDLVLNPSVSDAVMTLLREQEDLLIDNVDELSYEQLMDAIKRNKLTEGGKKKFEEELIKRFLSIIKR